MLLRCIMTRRHLQETRLVTSQGALCKFKLAAWTAWVNMIKTANVCLVFLVKKLPAWNMRSCCWALTPCRLLELKRVSWSIKVTKLLCYSYCHCLLVWSYHDKNSTKCQDWKQVHQASRSEPMGPTPKFSRSQSLAAEGKGLCSPSCKVVSLMWLPLALLEGLRCLFVMAASWKLNKFCSELLLSSYWTVVFLY